MITLLPFTLDDYKNWDNWIDNEEELIQFCGAIFSYPITKSQISDYLIDTNRFPFKVMLGTKPVGHAEIMTNQTDSINTANTSAKLCRILLGDKGLRGQGVGQIIIHELCAIAFSDMNVDEVYLNVYDWNIGAIKCYEKVGMTIVPDVCKTTPVGSEVWTTVRMSVDKDAFLGKVDTYDK